MSIAIHKSTTHASRHLLAAGPLFVLPVLAWLMAADWPAWMLMWSLAFSIYAGLKWLTFAEAAAAERAPLSRSLGYLLLWPGMDAEAFFTKKKNLARPALREWLLALAKTALGFVLIYVAAPAALRWHYLIAGWLGMAGIALMLHFGLIHLLSIIWRTRGVDAQPIMDRPILARSLSDFWGKRWNLAFRDAAHTLVFQPLVGKVGIAWAMLAVFLVSGLIHDLVISLSAGAGAGLPTLYFVLHGLAVLLERSRLGKRLGLGRGLLGRAFAAAMVLLPVGLLFHPPFIEQIVLPTLQALGAV